MYAIDRIIALSKEQGISLSSLCKKIDKTRTYLSEIASRHRDVPVEYIPALAEALHTTPEYLKGETDIKEKPAEAGGNKDITDDDLKFALFNGVDGVTDEMYEEVKRFAQFIKEREKKQYKIAARGGADHIDLTDEEKDAFIESTEAAMKKPQRNDLF